MPGKNNDPIFKPKAALIIKVLWLVIPLLIGGTWFIAEYYYGDQIHESRQDYSVKRISHRDSLFQIEQIQKTTLLLHRSEQDSINLVKLNIGQENIKSLMAILIKQQKGNSDTIVNRLLKLYSITINDEKKKLIASILKKNYHINTISMALK